MTHGHSLWFYLTWTCIVWYSTVTVYVAINGAVDIRRMLRDLARKRDDEKRDGK